MCSTESIPETDAPRPRGFFDLTPTELETLLTSWNQPRFRANQIVDWVYQKGVTAYAEMTNLPKALRDRLTGDVPLFESEVVRRQDSTDGVIKLLLQWPDDATSECVLIPEGERRTACISSQVGCPVGCVFCASGLRGLQRQLSAGEIVEQAMRIASLCGDGIRLSNVVFMGLGEPLANYAATVRAVRTINASWGMGIGARKITVSTVGLVNQMRRLAEEGLQITLAVSLHAPNDELRQRLIPWADRVAIDDLIQAGRYYFERTGREITLEYILLRGLNDGVDQARLLSQVTKRMRCNVNLISYNPVDGLPYGRSTKESVAAFEATLREAGVNVHVRRSRGLDIDAACGQLRRRSDSGTTPLPVIG